MTVNVTQILSAESPVSIDILLFRSKISSLCNKCSVLDRLNLSNNTRPSEGKDICRCEPLNQPRASYCG